MSNYVARGFALPENPDLEHLKDEAKTRLAVLRATAPDTQLAEAQFQLARDYGFTSWRALKDHVEGHGGELAACVGFYQHDPAAITNSCFHVTQSDRHLMIARTNGANFELTRRPDGGFVSPGRSVVYGFEKDGAGHVVAMTVDTDGRRSRLARIGAAEAGRIDAANARAREDQERARTAIILSPDILERHVGHYASPFGVALEVTRRDAMLFVQAMGQPRIPVSAQSETVFFYTGLPAQIHFRVEGGKTVGLALHQGGHEQVMARVTAEEAEAMGGEAARRLKEQLEPRRIVPVAAQILDRYAGRYRVADVREIEVTVEGGHIFAQITGQPKYEIHPESETKFFWTVVAAQIEFYRDHTKRVTHAVLHQYGRLIPLARLEDKDAMA